MLRRSISLLAVAAVLVIAPGATAAEPVKPAFDGFIELQATNGYHVRGLVVSYDGIGQATFFVGKAGQGAIYTARGEGTETGLDVDLGPLGEVDAEVVPTGKNEVLHSKCGGKGRAITIPANELVGTIEFHGEGGYTEASVTSVPLRIGPILDLICGGRGGVTTTSSGRLPGILLRAKKAGGPKLEVEQNHPGAPVFYEAAMHEKEGPVAVMRKIRGHLGAGALRFDPSLEFASFAAASPFARGATYIGRKPTVEASPGIGSWRGSLKVDFPGAPDVRLAGPGFHATIVHARRTESRG